MTEKINILLIEDHKEMCEEFRLCIQNHTKYHLYGVTDSQKTALEYLQTNQIDVLILDLELAEGNGINLAEDMRQLAIHQPFVVVTTNNCSDSILQYLRKDLKVDFVFQKINASYSAAQVLGMIDKVFKYHHRFHHLEANAHEDLRHIISEKLHQMGFTDNLLGTDYIISALLYLAEHPQEPTMMCKVIYPVIAQEYHTSAANIEKAIRTAIESVWSSTSLNVLMKHYPYEIKSDNGRPSNGEFVTQMRHKLLG